MGPSIALQVTCLACGRFHEKCYSLRHRSVMERLTARRGSVKRVKINDICSQCKAVGEHKTRYGEDDAAHCCHCACFNYPTKAELP